MRIVDLKTSWKLHLSTILVMLVLLVGIVLFFINIRKLIGAYEQVGLVDRLEVHLSEGTRAYYDYQIYVYKDETLRKAKEDFATVFSLLSEARDLADSEELEDLWSRVEVLEARCLEGVAVDSVSKAIRSNWSAESERLADSFVSMPDGKVLLSALRGIRTNLLIFAYSGDAERMDDVQSYFDQLAMASQQAGIDITDYHQLLTAYNVSVEKWNGVQVETVAEYDRTIASCSVFRDFAHARADGMRSDIIAVLFIVSLVMGVILLVTSLLLPRYISRMLGVVLSMANAFADGRFNHAVDERYAGYGDEFGGLLRAMLRMRDAMKESVGGIVAGAARVGDMSIGIGGMSDGLSASSARQAASTSAVSTSMEEMVSNIERNADNAIETGALAESMNGKLLAVGEQAGVVDASISSIAGQIALVNEIANQTNILALNAAVEAARAGEAGRGFAVVAMEVRKLAERSREAALEIEALSRESVVQAQQMAKALSDALPDVGRTTDLVREIVANSSELRSGSERVNRAIQELNSEVQQNAEAAEGMAASADELERQAEAFRQDTSYFSL